MVEPYRLSDDRLTQVIVAAAYQVIADNGFSSYVANITTLTITPSPTGNDGSVRNDGLVDLLMLRALCMVDQFSTRDAVRRSGVSFQEFSSKVDTKGLAAAWFQLLDKGACNAYEDARFNFLYGNGSYGLAILTPFRVYYNDYYLHR